MEFKDRFQSRQLRSVPFKQHPRLFGKHRPSQEQRVFYRKEQLLQRKGQFRFVRSKKQYNPTNNN